MYSTDKDNLASPDRFMPRKFHRIIYIPIVVNLPFVEVHFEAILLCCSAVIVGYKFNGAFHGTSRRSKLSKKKYERGINGVHSVHNCWSFFSTRKRTAHLLPKPTLRRSPNTGVINLDFFAWDFQPHKSWVNKTMYQMFMALWPRKQIESLLVFSDLPSNKKSHFWTSFKAWFDEQNFGCALQHHSANGYPVTMTDWTSEQSSAGKRVASYETPRCFYPSIVCIPRQCTARLAGWPCFITALEKPIPCHYSLSVPSKWCKQCSGSPPQQMPADFMPATNCEASILVSFCSQRRMKGEIRSLVHGMTQQMQPRSFSSSCVPISVHCLPTILLPTHVRIHSGTQDFVKLHARSNFESLRSSGPFLADFGRSKHDYFWKVFKTEPQVSATANRTGCAYCYLDQRP